jgi:acetoin utilization protein AcuB
MKVKEIMTRDPLTIDPAAPLGTAVDVMRTKQIRHLPVVDDAGTLMGIITDRDLRHAALAPALAEQLSLRAQRRLRGIAEALDEMRVRDVMTWGPTTTHPEAPVAHAALVMFEKRVGSLPVVRDGKLVGIITERDLLKALLGTQPVLHCDPEGFLW